LDSVFFFVAGLAPVVSAGADDESRRARSA